MSKKPKRIPNPPRKCIFCGSTLILTRNMFGRVDKLPYLPKDTPNFSMLDVVVHKTHETKKEKRENRSAYSGLVKLVCESCRQRMDQLITK